LPGTHLLVSLPTQLQLSHGFAFKVDTKQKEKEKEIKAKQKEKKAMAVIKAKEQQVQQRASQKKKRIHQKERELVQKQEAKEKLAKERVKQKAKREKLKAEENTKKLKEKEREKKRKEKEKLEAQKEKQREKKLKEKEENALKPKRGRNAFSFFLKDNFKKSEAPVQQQFKDIIQKWKDLPESNKQEYQIKAKRDRERYLEEKKKWEATLPPKRPPSAFNYYLSENFKIQKERSTDQTAKSVFKQLVSQWKSLPENEKKPYADKANKAKEEFLNKTSK